MSGDQIKGLRDLQRANVGDITDIASQLLARQLIALGARGEPPPPLPPPPKKEKRVRRCSPTSKATLQPRAVDGGSRRTWYRISRLKRPWSRHSTANGAIPSCMRPCPS